MIESPTPTPKPALLAVAFGGGTNSTAMLCGFRERGIKPDLILFARPVVRNRRESESMSLMDEWLEKALADAEAKKAAAKAAEKAAEKAARPKGQKCSNCVFYRGHPFSPRYHYCSLGRSRHTPNNFAKIKPGGWCAKWEEKQP